MTFSLESKGQSAIEYLMTYGWMLLVVAIVGGAVFSMVGEQNIENVQGFDSQDVNIGDFGVSTQNGLMFSINDPLGQTSIKEITISDTDTANVSYQVSHSPSEEDVVNLPGIIPSDEGGELEVEVTYDSGSLENLTTSGTVIGGLEVDENFNNRELILDGLVGYWPLGETYSLGDKAYDLTRNDNHGIKKGSPSSIQGAIGDAYEFNEEDYVEIEHSDVFNVDSITASIWVKPTEETEWKGVYTKDYEYPWGFLTNNDEDINGVNWYVRNEDGNREEFRHAEWDVNQWNHVVGIYDTFEGRQALYVNGQLKEEMTRDSLPVMKTDNSIMISNDHQYPGFEMSGGDIKIYDRALSEGEIEAIYEQENIE